MLCCNWVHSTPVSVTLFRTLCAFLMHKSTVAENGKIGTFLHFRWTMHCERQHLPSKAARSSGVNVWSCTLNGRGRSGAMFFKRFQLHNMNQQHPKDHSWREKNVSVLGFSDMPVTQILLVSKINKALSCDPFLILSESFNFFSELWSTS